VSLLDVAEDAAGADRGELVIITNQPNTRPAVNSEPDCGVEGQGVGHARFVNDDQRRRSDPRRPVRQVAMIKGLGEFGQSLGADAGLLTENCSGGSGRGEADDLAAVVGPGEGEGAHGRGLPGAGRGDRQL
jgi:hypothetical protein